MSNPELEQAVMAALADNPHVHPDEIAVQAIGDWVILRGTVATPVQHAEVVRTASRVAGVDRVDDMVAIRPLGIADRADVDTEAAVLAALIHDPELPAAGIDVDAQGDTVTLSGFVDVMSQRERAERVARGVGGVAHVHNELRVFAAGAIREGDGPSPQDV